MRVSNAIWSNKCNQEVIMSLSKVNSLYGQQWLCVTSAQI